VTLNFTAHVYAMLKSRYYYRRAGCRFVTGYFINVRIPCYSKLGWHF